MGNYDLIKFDDLEFIEIDAIESRRDLRNDHITERRIIVDQCVYTLPDGVECIIRCTGENLKTGTKWYTIAIIGIQVITASDMGVTEVLEREILKRTTSEWETIN